MGKQCTQLQVLNKFEKYKFILENQTVAALIFPEGVSPLMASW